MPWFKPPDPLKFSCLGCLWTNPCYHTSQSTTVTNYTKGRSLQTGDNYWMHSFPPFTGHQNQRSQSSQMLAIWDCWFRISKYSVTRSLFLQQVNESWTNSTGHLNTVRRLRDLHKICHPVLLRWPSDTYQQTPPKKKCTVRMPQTHHFYSPIPAIPTNPRCLVYRSSMASAPSRASRSCEVFVELRISRRPGAGAANGPWGCTRWTGRSSSGKKRVTTRPLGVASSNALSLGDEAVEVWSQAGDINGKASKISKWILWEFRIIQEGLWLYIVRSWCATEANF